MVPSGRLRAWAGRLALLLVSLGAAELLLHGAARLVPAVDALTGKTEALEPVVRGPRGDIRGNPDYPEHDAGGFRNEAVPEAAGVVALGDSHTWGTSVGRDETWPALLAGHLGATVYNMGLPTWGVRHYEEALPDALALDPRVVVAAVYLGNDLYDDFLHLRDRGLLGTELEPAEIDRISVLETDGSIQDEARRLFRAGDPAPAAPDAVGTSLAGGIRDLLSDHSRLYGVVRALRHVLMPPPGGSGLMDPEFRVAAAAVTEARAPFISVVEGRGWRTLLTAPYRALLLDTRDPRIEVGLASATGALIRMADRVEADDRRFLVVLLPTKESVFASRIADSGRHPGLGMLVEAESTVRARLTTALQARGVEVLDPLGALRGASPQPYFENVDGHPSAMGHEVVAREVAAALERVRRPTGS